jgi:NAD(P)-dependent dehydrogenase (short-subunit alcohol dehydrogenase family)
VNKEIDSNSIPDKLDGLAYCPGSINLKPFHRLKIDDFRNDIEINYIGAIKILQASLSALKASDLSSVILFSTVAVQTGMAFHATVAGAKGAIEGLTRSLASEYAPKIRFNCIAPSLTDTPMAERLLANDKKREAFSKNHPLDRVGKAEDIASMAKFLLSEQSSWITGQIIHVDGGMSNLK